MNSHLKITVLVAVLSCIVGLSLSRSTKRLSTFKSFMDNGQVLHRQARDDSGSDSDSSESNEEVSPCEHLYACYLPNQRHHYSETLLSSFHYDQVPDVLAQVCSAFPSNPATCDTQGCDDSDRIQIDAAHLNRLWDWICRNSAGFQEGITCWSDAFRTGMQRCSELYGSRHNRRDFIDCSVEVVERSGDACTANDAAFLQSLLQQAMYSA